MSSVNKKTTSVTCNHGLELLTSVAHAEKLYEINGSTLWMDTINRKMKTLKVNFDDLEDGAKIPVGCNKSSSNLVFNARMTLKWKTLWAKDGNRTPETE